MIQQTILLLAQDIWIYATGYITSVAIGASFFAVFFFFWTRTGTRRDHIDLRTKYMYINPLYWILRISLGLIIVSKIIEIVYLRYLATQSGFEASFIDIFVSHAGLPVYLLLIILTANTVGMYYKISSYFYGIPLSIVSWLFLSYYLMRNDFINLDWYFIPVPDSFKWHVMIYCASVALCMLVFNTVRMKLENK